MCDSICLLDAWTSLYIGSPQSATAQPPPTSLARLNIIVKTSVPYTEHTCYCARPNVELAHSHYYGVYKGIDGGALTSDLSHRNYVRVHWATRYHHVAKPGRVNSRHAQGLKPRAREAV